MTEPNHVFAETFLDKLEFGEYIPDLNDCDRMSEKARDTIRLTYPTWRHGQRLMFGLFIPQAAIVGHGILALKCVEGTLHYDCTTQSGKDGSRFRVIGWLKSWLHYAQSGYILFWWYTEWGEYSPGLRFALIKKMNPVMLYGSLFSKIKKLPVRR